jgi:Family of unknown function (DUF5761)
MSSLQGAPLPDFTLPYTSHAPGGQNGRVSFHPAGAPSASGYTVPDEAGFQHRTQTEVSFAGSALRGNWEKTPLSDAFFTGENVRSIQAALRKGVYEASGPKKYQISDQSADEITMVMRAMYLQYAKNSPYNIQGQIQVLNDMVVKWSVPRILSEIEGYFGYLKDISTLPVPLPQPIHLSSAGTRSLPFKNQM